MAISNNPLLKNYRGHIKKQLVIRQVAERTIISTYPNMKDIVPSPAQRRQRMDFKTAQSTALQMLKDPQTKALYLSKCVGRQRPHNVLIAELMAGTSAE